MKFVAYLEAEEEEEELNDNEEEELLELVCVDEGVGVAEDEELVEVEVGVKVEVEVEVGAGDSSGASDDGEAAGVEEGVTTGTEEDERGISREVVVMISLLVGAAESWAFAKVKECDARTTREKNVRMRAADAEQQRMIGFEDGF